MKRIGYLLCALLLLAACQPTPQVDAVKQKDTNQLIETVTVAEQSGDVAWDLPKRFVCDFYTEAQHAHVTCDAPIRILTDGTAFPTVRVEKSALPKEQRMALAQRLLGAETLYRWEYRLTKEDVVREIERLLEEPTDAQKRAWMRDDPENTEEAWEETMARRKAELAQYQEMYRSMDDGEAAPLEPWDGSSPTGEDRDWTITRDPYAPSYSELVFDNVECFSDDIQIVIRYTKGYDTDRDGSLSVFSFDYKANGEMGTYRIAPEDYGKPQSEAKVTAADAAKVVLSYLDGLGTFRVADIYWSGNAPNGGDDAFVAKRWAYVVRLTPDCGGAWTPYCKDDAYDFEHAENNRYPSWAYSRVVAAVDGSGKLLSLEWNGVDRQTERISESTPLLPFAEIEARFAQQMNRICIGEEYINAELTVDDVQLGLFRVREPYSMETGLLVPAWYFRGQLISSEESGWHGSVLYYDHSPLLILNAIDGSVIDPQKGY